MDQTAVKKLRVLAQTNDDVFAPAMFKHLQQICMVKDLVKLTKARHHRDATYKVINGQHYESCIQRVDQFGCLIGYSSWFKTADLTKVKVSKLMQSRSAT